MKKTLKHIILMVAVLQMALAANAQIERANKLFDAFQYPEAIRLYEKVLKKHPDNAEALLKTADAYRKIRNLEKAEEYYGKVIESGTYPDNTRLVYGKVLMSNNKVGLARAQFEQYLKKHPSDLLGKLLLQSCNDIDDWKKEQPWFEVSKVDGINSDVSDFSPVPFNHGLVFVSDRQKDYLNDAEFGWTERPYLSVFWVEEKGDDYTNFAKPKPFSPRINTIYHDGPVSFDDTNKVIYFTRVERSARGKDAINKLKLYKADLEKDKWKNIEPLPFNSDEYSVGHAAVSPDGKLLFFASDMPGGQGDMDIYMCEKQGEAWSEPKNLGPNVNTKNKEAFPTYNNGTLYFSSDGRGGYGGLDVYRTSVKDGIREVENLRSPINSGRDDFGMAFINEKEGFFSSDREGGEGEDDIYRFKMLDVVENTTSISGLIEFDKLAADNVKLNLLDENDVVIARTTTDENGRFKFDKLMAEESYLLHIDEEDIPEDVKVYLTNSNGEKVLVITELAKGKYKFEALKPDELEAMPLIDEEDESLLTVRVSGQVYEKIPGDRGEGMDVLVLNDDGEILARATTDKEGRFVFKKLSPDEEYLFKIDEQDEKLNIIILNDEGEVLDYAERMKNGRFKYKRIAADEEVLTLINEEDVVIKIRSNENFKISNIYYDYNSTSINPQAQKELDKLVTILKKNKHIGAELSSHTDARGSDEFNLELSQKRADKAVDYIISKGIDRSRIVAKGYGETKLVNKCANGVECTEEEHGKNRRTEFTVYKL